MTIPVIIDIIAASVLLLFVLLGAKRGLFRTLAGVLMIILAMTGARIAADRGAPAAAQFLVPSIERYIQSQLDEALPAAPSVPGQMPEAGAAGPEELLELLGLGGARLEQLAEELREEVLETGVSLLTAAARRMAESLLYGVIYILAFGLALALLRWIVNALDLMMKLPVLHGANALGGALVGLLEGALVLLILLLLLRTFGLPVEESRVLRPFSIFMTHLS